MPPEGTDLVLPSDIPDGERNVLVFDSLDIETLSKIKTFISKQPSAPQAMLTNRLWGWW
jgi:hypothetical protein